MQPRRAGPSFGTAQDKGKLSKLGQQWLLRTKNGFCKRSKVRTRTRLVSFAVRVLCWGPLFFFLFFFAKLNEI